MRIHFSGPKAAVLAAVVSQAVREAFDQSPLLAFWWVCVSMLVLGWWEATER